MLHAVWSAKGGSGATVVAAALARLLASRPGGAVLADLAGDAAVVLGLPQPEAPGLGDWSAAGPDVPLDALRRIELDAGSGLAVLPRGPEPVAVDRAPALAAALTADPRPVVVDCGTLSGTEPGAVVARHAPRSLLVLRPCYLAVRRALDVPITADGIVLVGEAGRALGRTDLEAVLDVPVVAEIPHDPAVARAVDAGLLGSRLPRALVRPLGAIEQLVP